MINVKSPPSGTAAKGDGTTNDQPALQAMIDNKLGALYFPPGRYALGSTLTFREKTGYHVIGSGMAERLDKTSSAVGAESALVWTGGANGVMVDVLGEGLVWNGLNVWGCNIAGSSSSCPSGRAATGIRIRRPSTSSPVNAGKIWFGSLVVDYCDTAIAAPIGTSGFADKVAFGFFWPRECTTALHLQDADSMDYTFEYVHAEDCDTLFKVTNGGRIFTQAVRVLSDNTTVLDVSGGDDKNAFYHLNGVALDDGVDGVYLLRNVSSAAQGHHFRFTNAHFVCSDESPCPPSSSSAKSSNCHPVEVLIDRRNSPDGQTVLEFVGCRGLAALDSNVRIHGDSATKKSHLIVRESEITRAGFLIDTATPSSNYTYKGIDNWTYGCGVVDDDSGSG